MTDTTALATPASRLRLWTEFVALFVGVPILMAVYFGSYSLFAVIWILAGIAAALLVLTPGFSFRSLLRGPALSEWRVILIYVLICAGTCLAVVFWKTPQSFLSFPLGNPAFWALVMVAYPIASAWPQELIYRSLFFERYESLFPNPAVLIAVNGAAFGFGHLFYMEWITIAVSAAGGAVIGWAYLRGRSMLLAWVLHAVSGQIIFTVGLGRYFYHGAVG